MVIKRVFLTCILSGMLLCSNGSIAYKAKSIQWEALNLAEWQKEKIDALDSKWQITNNSLSKQIINDKNKLKYLFSNPYSSDNEIKAVQSRILQNQNELRSEAMNNFLQKRNILSVLQRKKLHSLLSN